MEQDEIAILARRAGLTLTAEELADLQAANERLQAQLQALRSRLRLAADTEEPALTFSAQAGAR
jgi:hypothetical protein